MRRFCIFLFLFSLFTSFIVKADYMPEGRKGVTGYVKVEGWDVIGDDYLVITRSAFSSSGDNCQYHGSDSFSLFKDYRYYGMKPPIDEAYGLGLIRKDLLLGLDPAILWKEFTDDSHNGGIYSVSCDSDIYRSIIWNNKELPASTEELDENSPVERIDYIVTFKDLNPDEKTFDYEVSEPIEWTDTGAAGAISFEESLYDHEQTIEFTGSQMDHIVSYIYDQEDIIDRKRALLSEYSECPVCPVVSNSDQFPEKYTITTFSNRRGVFDSPVWKYSSYISVFFIGGLISLVASRMLNNKNRQKESSDQSE
jgi:hypothetical protein